MDIHYKKNKENNFIVSKFSNNNYGFIDWNKMPKGHYISNSIDSKGTNWVKTKDLSYGINHCAATASTNIALYYANKGYSNLIIDNEYTTFLKIHKKIKNGPIISIANKTKQYFYERGYDLEYSPVGSFDNLKKAVAQNRPCALVLSASLLNWHWVLAVGWRVYDSGEKYIQIVDGWNGNDNRFYKINSIIPTILLTQYWLR